MAAAFPKFQQGICPASFSSRGSPLGRVVRPGTRRSDSTFSIVHRPMVVYMRDTGLTEKELSLILTTFNHYPKIGNVILFGSRAKGMAKKNSDIDLAVDGQCDDQASNG